MMADFFDPDELERNKLVKCPRCGTENRIYERKDCRVCVCDLINYCSNPNCRFENAPNARYCKKCGSLTAYSKNGVFDKEYCKPFRRDALATLRKYKKLGIYYQWDNGPMQDYDS